MTKEADDLFDDEVTTGATLDSGTTVGGNTVYHLGNDGQGSGLDADTVDGGDVAVKGDAWVLGDEYTSSLSSSGSIQPPTGINDISHDPDGSLWYTNSGSVYQIDQSGSILTQFGGPSTSISGCEYGESDSVWVNKKSDPSYNPNSTYRLDQSGTVQSKFSAPSYCQAIAQDSTGCLWHANGIDPGSLYVYDKSGNQVKALDNPANADQSDGIAIDKHDSVWYTDVYSGNSTMPIEDQDGQEVHSLTRQTYKMTIFDGFFWDTSIKKYEYNKKKFEKRL